MPRQEDLEKRTKRLDELAKEKPGTLVMVNWSYRNETFVSVGFTHIRTVCGDLISLHNSINELHLHIHPNNFMKTYIEKEDFIDYCHLKKS